MRPSVGLATLPHPSAVAWICGPLHPHSPWAFMACNGDTFTFYLSWINISAVNYNHNIWAGIPEVTWIVFLAQQWVRDYYLSWINLSGVNYNHITWAGIPEVTWIVYLAQQWVRAYYLPLIDLSRMNYTHNTRVNYNHNTWADIPEVTWRI